MRIDAGEDNALRPGTPEQAMKAAVANQSAASEGRAEWVSTRHLFVNSETNFVTAVDPFTGHLAYFDDDHLSAAGAFRMERLLRTLVFDRDAGTTC